MRYRVTFAKTAAMRYTSHLDLHRTWERTVRRARLPLAYSQGFNPHPKLNLASALPLGFTGEQELIDIWLEQDVPTGEVQAALEKAAPPGIQIHRVERLDESTPTLQKVLTASEFMITFLTPQPDLDERVAALLQAGSLPREKRGKAYDLRPLVYELRRIEDDEEGRPRLLTRLAAREGATGRPEEVIAALGAAPEDTRVHRTQILLEGEAVK